MKPLRIIVAGILIFPALALTARTNTSPKPEKEYTITPPIGWESIQNPRFHKVWIRKKKDSLSPQIYFTINRDMPEPSPEKIKQLAKEMETAVRATPDGKLVEYSSTRKDGMLRIDFRISYSIYQKEKKTAMEKRIRAFFTRGDQFLFMSLFRKEESKTSLAAFEKTTASLRINSGAPKTPHPSRRYGIFSNAVNAVKKYWFILIPILIFSGITIWRGKKKQVDDR